MLDPTDTFFTVKQLAARWQVSELTVRRLISTGQLDARRIGRSVRIHPRAVAAAEDAMTSPQGLETETAPETSSVSQRSTNRTRKRKISRARESNREHLRAL